MATQDAPELPREAVGIFHEAAALDAARDDLLRAGFDRADLSFLASEHAVEEKLGQRYRRASALADDPATPRVAYVSTEAIGGAEGALIGGLFYVGAARVPPDATTAPAEPWRRRSPPLRSPVVAAA